MRAIIIDDKDAKALVSKLELVKMRSRLDQFVPIEVREKLTQIEVESIINSVHRMFHYEVVVWLQEQGASLH